MWRTTFAGMSSFSPLRGCVSSTRTSRPTGSSSPSTETSSPVGERSRVRPISALPVGPFTFTATRVGERSARARKVRSLGSVSPASPSERRDVALRVVVEIEGAVVEVDVAELLVGGTVRRRRRRSLLATARSAASTSDSSRPRSSGAESRNCTATPPPAACTTSAVSTSFSPAKPASSSDLDDLAQLEALGGGEEGAAARQIARVLVLERLRVVEGEVQTARRRRHCCDGLFQVPDMVLRRAYRPVRAAALPCG